MDFTEFRGVFPKTHITQYHERVMFELSLHLTTETVLGYVDDSRQYRAEGTSWRDRRGNDITYFVKGWRRLPIPEIIEGQYHRAIKNADDTWMVSVVDTSCRRKRLRLVHRVGDGIVGDYNTARLHVAGLDAVESRWVHSNVEFSMERHLSQEEKLTSHGFNPNFDPNVRYYPL